MGWPVFAPETMMLSGVNHLGGTLTMPDGRAWTLEPVMPPANPPFVLTYISGQRLVRPLDPSRPPADMMMSSRPEGDNIKLWMTFAIGPDEWVDPPPILIPAAGGSRTVSLPGGATLNIVIDGAHPLTDEEKTRADRMQQSADAIPAAVAAGRISPPGPPRCG